MPTRKSSKWTKLYFAWYAMKQRCSNPKEASYRNYGGRGIRVCSEWKNSFQAFYDWAIEKGGYKPGLTVERINNNGHYSPRNCAFVTKGKQAINRRTCNMITAFGETKCLLEWVRDKRCKTGRGGLDSRIKKGMDPEKAITTPSFAPKEFCKRGHPYDEENTYYYGNGKYKCCRTCNRDYAREKYRREHGKKSHG